MEEQKRNLDLMNVKEASVYLKFSTAYLYRLAREKKIPHINYGRHLLFRKADLFDWLGSMVDGGVEKEA